MTGATLKDAVLELTHVRLPDHTPNYSDTETMKALVYHGTKDIRCDTVPKPLVTDPRDCVVKVTSTTICGSDLHLYHSFIPEMSKGDIIGHEFCGVVESIGPDVKNLKVGDRVVVSGVIAEGHCGFCKAQQYSLCDGVNDSKAMEYLYGHRISGGFGYSHLTGGFPGGQAQFTRVPFADVNTLKIPDGVPDERVLLLSDVLSTAYHGNELGEVSKGDVVAVWGCGPVGLASVMWAFHRGAKRVLAIDSVQERLDKAKSLGAEVIDFKAVNVLERIRELVPGGPDVCIEVVGARYAKSWQHSIQKALMLETDAIDTVTECIKACKKGGHVALIGDFIGYANQYPIGAQMEKGLTVRGGQLWCQKYWDMIMDKILKNEIDPSFLITDRMPLEQGPEAYRRFDNKENGVLKVILKPWPEQQE
ncbi:hypothetical protein RI367_005989 [Sorochytrium milnesiophthora]